MNPTTANHDQDAAWRFASSALEIMSEPSYQKGQRTPFLTTYNEDLDRSRLYFGKPGQAHSDMKPDELENDGWYVDDYGALEDKGHEFYTSYGEHRNQVVDHLNSIGHPPAEGWNFAHVAKEAPSTSLAVPDLPGAEPWRPGLYGKGYQAKDGTIYHWHNPTVDEYEIPLGDPSDIHHDHVIQHVDPHDTYTAHERTFTIDPDGRLVNNHPFVDEVNDRLKSISEAHPVWYTDSGWSF